MNNLKILRKCLLKGTAVILTALVIIGSFNIIMQSFLDYEYETVRETARLAAEAAAAGRKIEADKLKIKQANDFYEKYKHVDCYHYHGQFYEMFEQLERSDIIILGTSHAAHGINPKYLDNVMPEHSFFNFALNGSNPSYYVDWYDVFKESGYPKPKLIIMCVDWFMFDDTWLWRRIAFDDSPNCPIDIMRKIRKSSERQASNRQEEQNEIGAAMENTVQKEQIPWWNIDELLTVVFNKIPIIASRDRMPDMFRWIFSLKSRIDESSTQAETEPFKNNEEVPLVYYKTERRYISDSSGNITSEYYKGFIPWEAQFDGAATANSAANNNPKCIKDFTKLLDMFAEDGIPFIFVEVPEYIPGRNADGFEQNNRYLKELAEKYSVPFLNYNTELSGDINIKDIYFSDWGHMNNRGSTVFSKLLAEEIKSIID